MAGFGDLVQKAFYLGVGAASYAGEKAGNTLKDLRAQTQTVVNELVERGELTAEEAQQLMNKMMQRAEETAQAASASTESSRDEPRRIEILDDDDSSAEIQEAEALRQQVDTLREQLEELKRKSNQ